MFREPLVKTGPDGEVLVKRFSRVRRFEHYLCIAAFVVLVLTGFPQKFHDNSFATWVFDLLGGLDRTRFVHRAAGVVFSLHAFLHILGFTVGFVTGRMSLDMLPIPQDLRDAWHNLGWYLGTRDRPPELPKYDYRQKFEYIGIVFGGLVMVVSGLVLMYPSLVAGLLPGEVIPASRVAHSNEALLALSVLVVWHVYGSHLSPEIFPMDKTIFTGYIPAHELEERHHREYRRIFPRGHAQEPPPAANADAEPLPAKVA